MRTLEQLRREAVIKGVDSSQLVTRADYQRVLASPTDIMQVAPMLAHDTKKMSSKQLTSILIDNRFVSEEKMNGIRMKLHVRDELNRLDTRVISDVSHIYTERTLNFPHIVGTPLRDMGVEHGTILDGELIMLSESINTGSVITACTLTSTQALVGSSPERALAIQKVNGPAYYYVFDVPRIGGFPCEWEFAERRQWLEGLFEDYGSQLNENGIFLLPQYTDKEEHFNRVKAAGGEGIMLKKLDSHYKEGLRVHSMLKMKVFWHAKVFIIGSVPAKEGKFGGLVGSLTVAVFDGSGHSIKVGACQPGDDAMRRKITGPNSTLQGGLLGKVINVRYYGWTTNMLMRNCTLEEWCPDSTSRECRYDMDKIAKMIARKQGKDEV